MRDKTCIVNKIKDNKDNFIRKSWNKLIILIDKIE